MLALAFRILHIRQFLETSNHSTDELEKTLQDVLNKPGATKKILLAEMLESSPIIQDYLDFEQSACTGNHGSTAAFWMMYIDLVDLYLMFSRASRTNNLQVFIYSLRQMIPLFFAGSRPNYARWMVRYFFNLINCNDKVHKMLEEGALSIGRKKENNNMFNRNPVDMTLEETINADAASKFTGIGSFF